MGRLKKALLLLFAAAMFLLCACGKKALSWQEQYDLGVRYLSDGNYQEAVIAFEAAITIDAKRSEAYLGAAEAYIAVGDIEAARNILEKGLEATGDQDIAARLQELLDGSEFDINALFTTALQGENVISYANIPELFQESTTTWHHFLTFRYMTSMKRHLLAILMGVIFHLKLMNVTMERTMAQHHKELVWRHSIAVK